MGEAVGVPGDGIDTTVPHSARVWNYFLGGKDNYAVDRAAGDEYRRVFPGILDIARADRGFLVRAVRYLVREAGIRQFLDIGTGLPTMNNTHEVAQGMAAESRIVYVDNDPLVLAHARALLTSTPEGRTTYLHADLRDPDPILAEAADTLDLRQPVGLMLLGILHFIDDLGEARRVVGRVLDALPSGSYLALTHATFDLGNADTVAANEEAQRTWNENAAQRLTARTREEVGSFFDGLELVEPGLVSMSHWRPDETPFGTPAESAGFCGLARKP